MAGAKGRSGGRRAGAGRKPVTANPDFRFREWCRAVVARPEVREGIAARAETDPEFALKVAEHGFGRPPQSLDVKVGGDGTRIDYRVQIEGGGVVAPAATGVPTAAPRLASAG